MASVEQIKSDDYNLNIPRYVDTFEAEDAINSEAIATQLKEIQEQSKVTDAKIASFCQESGTEPPF